MSIKELKEREKEQRREYIVDAAEKLFFSRGYENVAMNDIAEAVGMNKATLYLYFENKDALYFAIVLRGLRIMNELFRGKLAKETTGLGKLGAAGEAYLEFNHKYPHYYRLFHYAGSERFDPVGSADAAEVARLSSEVFFMMSEAIGIGMGDGTLRKGLNPTTVAIFLASTSETIVSLGPNFLSALESQGVSHEQFIKESMELMQFSIATQQPTKKSD